MQIELSLLLTVLAAIASNAYTLWRHGRDYQKERKQYVEDYAQTQVQTNGYIRDINHTKRDIAQMSENIRTLDDDYEKRFREVEHKLSELSGAFEVMRMMINRRRIDD